MHQEADIKVSVLMITYNHESLLAQAIESVLEQQVSFEYEIVIGEDCSTDNTRAIVKAYQEKYPDRIRALLPTANLGMTHNFEETWRRCRGKYIALLEGDDYWTSPNKLQAQVDFLDSHAECSMCFHNVMVVYQDGSQAPRNFSPSDQKSISDLRDLLYENFIATPSVMFRNHLFDRLPTWFHQLKMGDWTLHILNAQFGKIGYLDQVMAVYRIHQGGVWSSSSQTERLRASVKMFEFMNAHFQGKYNDLISYHLARFYKALAIISLKQRSFVSLACYSIQLIKSLTQYVLSSCFNRR